MVQTASMHSNDFKPLFLALISLLNTNLGFLIVYHLLFSYHPLFFPHCIHHNLLLFDLSIHLLSVSFTRMHAAPRDPVVLVTVLSLESNIVPGTSRLKSVSRKCPIDI